MIVLVLVESINKNEGGDFEQTKIATKALADSIDFASHKFEDEEERDQLMGKIFEAVKVPQPSVKENVFGALGGLVRFYYEYIG